jgi:hypothetical protein
MDVIYPDIEVPLTGEDGNAMSIIGRVSEALRRGGVPKKKVNEFCADAMSGDYDNVLQTAMRWVSVS